MYKKFWYVWFGAMVGNEMMHRHLTGKSAFSDSIQVIKDGYNARK